MLKEASEFKMYLEGDKPDNFITLRNATITFSKAAVEALDYTEFVHMFLDEKNHRVAFGPCPQDESAIRFYKKPEQGKQMLIRLANKKRCQAIMELAGITDCGKGIRYYGEFYKDEKMLVFNLK